MHGQRTTMNYAVALYYMNFAVTLYNIVPTAYIILHMKFKRGKNDETYYIYITYSGISVRHIRYRRAKCFSILTKLLHNLGNV